MPVCIPKATAMPRMVMNRTSGTRPDGGGPFLLSVIANNTNKRTKVPRN
jgi:hypothetical protein